MKRKTKTYFSWSNMKTRCSNDYNDAFARYEARGIKVCARWQSYDNFLADMGEKPEGMTLERIDNSKGYSPDNCKWASYKEQAGNRRPLQVTDAARVDSKSGIRGVYPLRNGRWEASGEAAGVRYRLYAGHDFIEACCRRKSWEAAQKRSGA